MNKKLFLKIASNEHLSFCTHLKLRPYCSFEIFLRIYLMSKRKLHVIVFQTILLRVAYCILILLDNIYTLDWSNNTPWTVILPQATILQKSQIYCVLKHGFNFLLSFCWSFTLYSVLDLVNHFMMSRNGLFLTVCMH